MLLVGRARLQSHSLSCLPLCVTDRPAGPPRYRSRQHRIQQQSPIDLLSTGIVRRRRQEDCPTRSTSSSRRESYKQHTHTRRGSEARGQPHKQGGTHAHTHTLRIAAGEEEAAGGTQAQLPAAARMQPCVIAEARSLSQQTKPSYKLSLNSTNLKTKPHARAPIEPASAVCRRLRRTTLLSPRDQRSDKPNSIEARGGGRLRRERSLLSNMRALLLCSPTFHVGSSGCCCCSFVRFVRFFSSSLLFCVVSFLSSLLFCVLFFVFLSRWSVGGVSECIRGARGDGRKDDHSEAKSRAKGAPAGNAAPTNGHRGGEETPICDDQAGAGPGDAQCEAAATDDSLACRVWLRRVQ
jgi:hypothetical protein